jgi:hypothetical protein
VFRRQQPFVLNDGSIVSRGDGSLPYDGDCTSRNCSSDDQSAASDNDYNNTPGNCTSDDVGAYSCCGIKLQPAE